MHVVEKECRWTIVYAYVLWATRQGLAPLVIFAESVVLGVDLGLSE